MATEKKEREIIQVGEKAKRAKITPEAKKRAAGLRWAAVILWLLAVGFEVLVILLLNGTLYIPGNEMAYLIIGIVLDLACVIAGSQLWKKSNRINPASKKNKLKFFLWNQMGVIAAVIAFVPLVILLLKDKDLNPKTKKIVSIIAAIAALLAVGTSINYNPVSSEDLAAAQAESYTYSDGMAYWTRFGKCYHFNPDCQSLQNSASLYNGTIEEAFEANRSKPCSFCADDTSADFQPFKTASNSDVFTSPSDILDLIGDDLLAPVE